MEGSNRGGPREDSTERFIEKEVSMEEERHDVDLILVPCSDARLDPVVKDVVKSITDSKVDCDTVELAGGAWNLTYDAGIRREVVVEDLALLSKGHHCNKVAAILHEGCAKLASVYGDKIATPDQEEDLLREKAAEVFKTLTDMSLEPTIILMRRNGVNPETRKMEFRTEDITEASRRYAEVGER